MPSLVEISQMVLKKILNLGNVFLQLRNYFPLKKCVVFYLKKKLIPITQGCFVLSAQVS